MKAILQEAQRMIELSSVTSEGNEALANYLVTLLTEKGIRPVLQPVSHSIDSVSKRQFNLLGTLGDPLVDRKTRKGLLFLNHLDTVDPGLPENWEVCGKSPFSMKHHAGRVYGLGAASGKIDFLCRLYAIEKYREKKLKMPIYLAGTCGGELGMFGAKYLLKSLVVNPRCVLVGEPTDLRIVHAHKFLGVYKIQVAFQQVERDAKGFGRRVVLESFGRNAHASTPTGGVNAVLGLFDFLRRVADAGFEMRFSRISGGGSRNQVPDRALTEFYLTSHQYEDFKRFFRDVNENAGLPGRFKAEMSGGGESGVRFLPETVHLCLDDFVQMFSSLVSDFKKVSDPTYVPETSTLNLGFVRQQVSGVELGFEIRLLPSQSPEAVHQAITEKVQAIASKYPNYNITVVRERMNPSLETSVLDEFPKEAQASLEMAKLPLEFAHASASSEASLFAQGGFPVLIFGPGPMSGSAHGPDEYLEVDQIEKAIEFYRRLIERTCL